MHPSTPAEALAHLPKKGSVDFPCESEHGWQVAEDLDAWGKERGYLTAVLFKRVKPGQPRTQPVWQHKLVLVGKCPFGSDYLRYYSIPMSTPQES